MTVELLLKLLTGENSLACVYDDNELTAICMGGKLRSVLAAKDVSSLNSGSAERLASCIDNEPSAFDGVLVSHESGHFYSSKYFCFLATSQDFFKLSYYTIRIYKCQHFFETFFQNFNLEIQSSENLSNARFLSRFLTTEKQKFY
jgi:hypothetical protein